MLEYAYFPVGPQLAENIASKQSDNPLKYIKSNDSATFLLKPVTSFKVLMCLNQLKMAKHVSQIKYLQP